MKKLITIQKRNNLNDVYRDNHKGPGGGYHFYRVVKAGSMKDDGKGAVLSCHSTDIIADIEFQRGPRNEPDSIHGVLDSDLLEIVRDRLKAFQEGEYATRENACAIIHIEEALMWMNKRAEDRAERGVLGTMNK